MIKSYYMMEDDGKWLYELADKFIAMEITKITKEEAGVIADRLEDIACEMNAQLHDRDDLN